MSEELSFSPSAGGESQGRNFRRAYYDSLLIRGEEEEKNVDSLESLLNADCIDVEGLKVFCQKHTLPPYHRLQVWNILLGVVPPYNDEETCSHVRRQREQQFCDLRRALFVSVATPFSQSPSLSLESKNQDISQEKRDRLSSEQLVFMYLLQNNCLPTSSRVAMARMTVTNSVPLARAFQELCHLDREAYWLFARFSKMMDTVDKNLLRRDSFQYIDKEDQVLSEHLRRYSEGIPFSLWFEGCFVSTLPETSLEIVWDRLIGGCVMILVFLAVAILLTFKRRLLGGRSPSSITEILTQIPEENCILIVMKAVELWEANGSPLLPSPTPPPIPP